VRQAQAAGCSWARVNDWCRAETRPFFDERNHPNPSFEKEGLKLAFVLIILGRKAPFDKLRTNGLSQASCYGEHSEAIRSDLLRCYVKPM